MVAGRRREERSSPSNSKEDTMLKTFSAALLAASLLTAPALAAGNSANSGAMNAKAQATTTNQSTATKPAASDTSMAKPHAKKMRHAVRHRKHHARMSASFQKSSKAVGANASVAKPASKTTVGKASSKSY
jgi:hypothetical protein